MCCAPGEATRGHNRVRDAVLGLASLADGTARPEVAGLIEDAPALRPADILTDAAFGRLTALDISIAAPHAAGAEDDAVATKVAENPALRPLLGEPSDGRRRLPTARLVHMGPAAP